MEHVKRSSIMWLVLANALALAILVLPVNAVRAVGGDYCSAEADGCMCWDGRDPWTGFQWSPSGCYDDPVEEEFDCHGGDWCED